MSKHEKTSSIGPWGPITRRNMVQWGLGSTVAALALESMEMHRPVRNKPLHAKSLMLVGVRLLHSNEEVDQFMGVSISTKVHAQRMPATCQGRWLDGIELNYDLDNDLSPRCN